MNELGGVTERRLAELGRATASLAARSGFTDRVMLAVGRSPQVFWLELLGASRRAVPLCLSLLVLAGLFALESRRASDHAVASADASEVFEW